MTWISVLAVAAMLIGLVVIPFGVPGLWLMIAAVLVLALVGQVSWTLGVAAVAGATAAELIEFLLLRVFGKAYGGSTRAFWGAVAGGTIGLFVGLPVPLVGPILTAFLGTFAGAGLVTFLETRSLERSARVGWGVLLARTLAVGVKVATALVVLLSVALALLV